jgi:hypothetical protein
LAVPMQRALIEQRWGGIDAPPLWAAFGGMVLSGIFCGAFVLVLSKWLRRVAGSKRTLRAKV